MVKKSWRLLENESWTAAAVVLLTVNVGVNPPEHSAVVLSTQTELCMSCMEPKHRYPRDLQDAHWSTIKDSLTLSLKYRSPEGKVRSFFFLGDQFCFLTRAQSGEQEGFVRIISFVAFVRRDIFFCHVWNQVKYSFGRRFFFVQLISSVLYSSDQMLKDGSLVKKKTSLLGKKVTCFHRWKK